MQIGVDIVEVERIKKAIETNKGFKEKIFTKLEIEYCDRRKNKFESYAGRFAAKEAFVKAMGTGFRNIYFLDIQVINDDLGKPILQYKNINANLSISHEKHYAVAMVIIEGE